MYEKMYKYWLVALATSQKGSLHKPLDLVDIAFMIHYRAITIEKNTPFVYENTCLIQKKHPKCAYTKSSLQN